MHIIGFFLILVFVLILVVVGTIMKFVFKVKNAFSSNDFKNNNDSQTYSNNDNEYVTGSQIVRSAEGRRRLDKLKQSAEIKDAEVVE